MNIPLGTYRARLGHVAALCLLNAAAVGTSVAADYASHDYGNTNTVDAAPAQSAPKPARQAPAPADRADLPSRGQTMAAVRAQHGPPRSTHGPVGRPPITRWDYANYHVYFEDNRVIHTVIPNDPEPLHHVDQLQAARP